MMLKQRTAFIWRAGLIAGVTATVLGCAAPSFSDEEQAAARLFHGTPGSKGIVFSQGQHPRHPFAMQKRCDEFQQVAAQQLFRVDRPLPEQNNASPYQPDHSLHYRGDLVSPGDLLHIAVPFGEDLNGSYVVDHGGFLSLPYIGLIEASGASLVQVEERIELALIREQIYRPDMATVSVSVGKLAAVEVYVSGAVFQPGRVLINSLPVSRLLDEQIAAQGDHKPKRLLSEAIRSASGIRPDAKLDQVILIRGGWHIEVDLTGILTGQPVKDYPMIAGDRVIVPSTGCFQSHLVRPSQITPKGFRVFMSNLIDSATNNAGGAVNKYATNLPYGTRLLQAAVSANCVGGKTWTNADRSIVLASRNPLTNETQVVERSVEDLIRHAHIDWQNPFLMPNDAVACYDSNVTNLLDVVSAIAGIVTPFAFL